MAVVDIHGARFLGAADGLTVADAYNVALRAALGNVYPQVEGVELDPRSRVTTAMHREPNSRMQASLRFQTTGRSWTSVARQSNELAALEAAFRDSYTFVIVQG